MHTHRLGFLLTVAGILAACLPSLHAQTTLIDFSNYTVPSTLSTATRSGTTLSADIDLLDSSGTTSLLRFRGNTGNTNGNTYTASLVSGPGLRISDSGNGQVFAMIQSTNTMNVLTTGTAAAPVDSIISYSVTFTVNTIGTGQLDFGLYNGTPFNYSSTNAQAYAVLAFQMPASGKVDPIRGGTSSIQHYAFSAPTPDFTGSTIDASAPAYSAGTSYRGTITMNTTTQDMTLSLFNLTSGSSVFDVTSNYADASSTAQNGGLLRFAFGEAENNGGFGWDYTISSIEYGITAIPAAVPEPGAYALVAGIVGLGFAMLIRGSATRKS